MFGSPLGGGDCSLPLSNNNLTHISTSEPQKSAPQLFLSVPPQLREHWSLPDRRTSTSQTLREADSAPLLLARWEVSESCRGLMEKLSGNVCLGNPSERDGKKGLLSEGRALPLCGLWRVSSTDPSHSAEGDKRLGLLKQRHKLAN